MNSVLNERLVAIGNAVRHAPHGQKESIYRTACEELQISRATLLRKLNETTWRERRKQRSDAGSTSLSREEALVISGTLMESRRNNNKQLYSLGRAVKALRANGMIQAGRVDAQTGEFYPLSDDAIRRALYAFRLHPDQLLKPTPALELASLHPNHVWELDASICVLYYLKNPNKHGRQARDTGLRIMERDTFYKNKPKNLERIVNDRVWSFEIADHTTHWIYAEYRFGGESAQNFLEVMINAMQDRRSENNGDVLCGVPEILFTDPGSALGAAPLLNMCHALGIKCIQHKARNARATGAVEKARDILERDFEAGLKFVRVDDIDTLNDLVRQWRIAFNGKAIHSRYGTNRTAKWLEIVTTGKLVLPPPVDVCRELAISAPETRTVTNKLRIKFRSQEFSVSTVPGANVGDELLVARNPWHENEARVIVTGEDGFETYYPVMAIEKDQWGYAVDAPVIGERYQTLPQSDAEVNRQEVEQAVYGTQTKEETEQARKARELPFGGRFNPYIEQENPALPAYLPHRGRASDVRTPLPEERRNPLEVVRMLRESFKAQGKTWRGEYYIQLSQRYPEGVPVSEIDAITAEYLALAGDVVVRLAQGQS